MRNKLILISAVLIILEASIHLWGVFADGYVRLWWLDILTHSLGGFWLSLTAIWLIWFSGYFRLTYQPSFFRIFISGSISVFSVAVLWEVFEYFVGINYSPEGYAIDTMLDIICGTSLGAVSSVLTAYLWKKNLN